MKSLFVSARKAVVALGLSATMALPAITVPAVSAPLAPIAQPAAPQASGQVVDVQYRDWRRDRGWRDRRDYRDWRRDRWRDRGDYRRWDRRRDRNTAIALGLGIGLPLAALAVRPAYDPYYAPRPVYREYAPRRVYRGGGSAHVDWCYNRYRSYRAYDNSFQPYNGPRQQCYSPYS
ncbi:BA14K family protein [Mesorhizobium sp. RP14(2022)]|uniref:Lectin-like protein BA14k n=1 Tax=Mesorhizobium liriopis TaxID=2953882 RepID=A0ABT1C7T8_9HYPH|nr:BA14K family protein [Mesorhizobium liriopis]MCO6050046.1 BA14K family protein [Mesorhizobium liriopis]